MPKNKKHDLSEAVLAADTVRRLSQPDEVELHELPIDLLEEDPGNPNSMTDEQFGKLVEVIGRVGMLQPVLVRKLDAMRYRIIDGHHRVRAARAAGLTAVASVIVKTEAAAAQILQIGMNHIRGEMDLASVARIFEDLTGQGFGVEEMALTGYEAGEIQDLLDSLQERNEEELLEGSLGGADDAQSNEPPMARPFVLELTFASKDELQRAKRALKRAADGQELGAGLLNMIDGDDNEDSN